MDDEKPKKMPYNDLEVITDNFSADRIIGRGTFGVVYKGEDEHGVEIAVKLLNPLQGIDDEVFDTELSNLTRLKHRNIVRLLGFCNEKTNVNIEFKGQQITAQRVRRALCFEYLHNGSLQAHLSDETEGLKWHARYKIIRGICEGLKYLHTGLKNPVYHLDLKPDNILLDKNMEPKIADFGLSRLLGEENTKNRLNVGTRGYLPPEYINFQMISKEFDIYSLGIIIMKITTGNTGYSIISDMPPAEVIKHVHKKWSEKLQEIEVAQVKRCVEIALKCIEEERKRRPHIMYITDQLRETEKHPSDASSGKEEESNIQAGHSPDISIDRSRGKNLDRTPSILNTLQWKELPLNFLKEITDDFSDQRVLSKSAFGTIYKGTLPDGKDIAVKKLAEDSPVPPGNHFLIEVENLMSLSHKNILKLIGFCREAQKSVVQHKGKYIIVDTTQCILCYEYASNGHLDDYISANALRVDDWDTRFRIIKGICQGLHFLHIEIGIPVIHLDLQPANIFLDDNMVAKIANFGLSRLLGEEQTRINTMNVVGKVGYMAPEYLYRGEISPQCDIYSLGILIIEITTGQKNNSHDNDKSGRKFISNIREKWTDEYIATKYSAILTPDELQQVKGCIETGLNCVNVDRKNRPSIVEIVDWLN